MGIRGTRVRTVVPEVVGAGPSREPRGRGVDISTRRCCRCVNGSPEKTSASVVSTGRWHVAVGHGRTLRWYSRFTSPMLAFRVAMGEDTFSLSCVGREEGERAVSGCGRRAVSAGNETPLSWDVVKRKRLGHVSTAARTSCAGMSCAVSPDTGPRVYRHLSRVSVSTAPSL